jgi:hypothetical protein
MARTSQPKFCPKKLVTSVQTTKKVASTVSRVTVVFRRWEVALKYVLVRACRSSVWRPSSPAACTRPSRTSAR